MPVNRKKTRYIIPEPAVQKVVVRLNTQKGIKVNYRIIPNTNHFYNYQVDVMIDHIHEYMNIRGVGQTVGMPKLLNRQFSKLRMSMEREIC